MIDLQRDSSAYTVLRYGVLAGLGFQVVHLVEHLAQTGFWAFNPTMPPWLTPWAMAGRDALVVDGTPASGNELLHLIGNGIFWAALLGLWALMARNGYRRSDTPNLGKAIAFQGVHVGEHIALSVSQLMAGTAIGLSTFLGLAEAGPVLWSYRVWFHFLLNLVATYHALRAAGQAAGLGVLIEVPMGRHTRPVGA